MFGWLKELLEIKYTHQARVTELTTRVIEEKEVCKSCETLRSQLEIANYEKQRLMDKLLEKPEVEINREPPQITRPKFLPWNVQKQILIREDREKARSLKNAAQADSDVEKKSTEELEKDLDAFGKEHEITTNKG